MGIDYRSFKPGQSDAGTFHKNQRFFHPLLILGEFIKLCFVLCPIIEQKYVHQDFAKKKLEVCS